MGYVVHEIAVGALDDAQADGGRGDVVPAALAVGDYALVGAEDRADSEGADGDGHDGLERTLPGAPADQTGSYSAALS